jgi:hypothetical protein
VCSLRGGDGIFEHFLDIHGSKEWCHHGLFTRVVEVPGSILGYGFSLSANSGIWKGFGRKRSWRSRGTLPEFSWGTDNRDKPQDGVLLPERHANVGLERVQTNFLRLCDPVFQETTV